MIIKLAQLAREKVRRRSSTRNLNRDRKSFRIAKHTLPLRRLHRSSRKKALARTRAILHATCSTDQNSCSFPLPLPIWGQRLPC